LTMAALQTRVGYAYRSFLEMRHCSLPLLRRRSSADAERVSGKLSVHSQTQAAGCCGIRRHSVGRSRSRVDGGSRALATPPRFGARSSDRSVPLRHSQPDRSGGINAAGERWAGPIPVPSETTKSAGVVSVLRGRDQCQHRSARIGQAWCGIGTVASRRRQRVPALPLTTGDDGNVRTIV
jgi:hypothetical protein